MSPFKEQFEELVSGTGIVDFTSRSKIKVTGVDRVSFLHNILTQDIKAIKTNGWAPAALLTPQAKVLLYMNVFVHEDFIMLDLESTSAKSGIEYLDKYLIAEDVILENVSEKYFHYTTKAPLKNKADFEFLTEKDSFSHYLFTDKQDFTVVPDKVFHQAYEIYCGIPRFGIDFTDKTPITETGLDAIAASEKKGCYPGQEVVARTNTYKGWVKKIRRFTFSSDSSLKKGDVIYSNGNEAGEVSSAVYLNHLSQGFGLGYFKKNFLEGSFSIEFKDKDVKGQVL